MARFELNFWLPLLRSGIYARLDEVVRSKVEEIFNALLDASRQCGAQKYERTEVRKNFSETNLY